MCYNYFIHYIHSLRGSVALALCKECGVLNISYEAKPVVGVAWHNSPGETYGATCRAIEAAGGTPVRLGQVVSDALDYDERGMLRQSFTDSDGVLTPGAAALVRIRSWHGSNAERILEGIPAIVFAGGPDVCPSLYARPQPTESAEGFCAERDVSDYLLMRCCLDRDIPILALCRGMQVLAIASGADMIQDIPDYLAGMGRRCNDTHRNPLTAPGAYRDFARHDVDVIRKDSMLYRLTGLRTIRNVPSWHHQAVKSVAGTDLIVTGVTETGGTEIIEAVERPDRTFVLGLQSHPEIAVVREMDETSLAYFKAIVNMARDKEAGL